jgi:hypothetical protein
MTRTEIENSLKDLNYLVMNGRLLDAFDKYYHDDVSMQENEMPPVVSKTANRQREQEFLNNVTELREIQAKGMGVGDDISFVIWKYDYTHKEWGVRNFTQVSIQEWKDGKIIKEKFVYSH